MKGIKTRYTRRQAIENDSPIYRSKACKDCGCYYRNTDDFSCTECGLITERTIALYNAKDSDYTINYDKLQKEEEQKSLDKINLFNKLLPRPNTGCNVWSKQSL